MSTELKAINRGAFPIVSFDPTPLRRPPSAGEPFPVTALGKTLGGAAQAITDKIQVANGLAGASVLAAASLVAQPHADCIIPATGQSRPLSLYLVSVAATGDRKSSADSEAMRPIRNRECSIRESYELQRADYQRAKRAFDAALAVAEKKAKGDRGQIVAALRAVGEEPIAPLLPFLLADEPSLEGLQKLFERGQPSLGLFSDEGAGFLNGFAMSPDNRLKTLAGLSQFWDGGTIRRIRAGDGATALIGKRLALHLMVQPEVSCSLLADSMAASQGFLSRVLVSAPPSLVGERMQRPISQETEITLRRYEDAMLALLEKPFPLAAGKANQLEPRHLSFDGQSKAAWLRLADEIEMKLRDGGEYEQIRGFANKLAEHVARIAGVLTLADNADAGEINSDALARAVALGDYFAGEALRLFEVGTVSPEIIQAEKTLAFLQSRGPSGFALATVYQHGPACVRDAASARRAVERLEAHGWVIRLIGDRQKIDGTIHREGWRLRGENERASLSRPVTFI